MGLSKYKFGELLELTNEKIQMENMVKTMQ